MFVLVNFAVVAGQEVHILKTTRSPGARMSGTALSMLRVSHRSAYRNGSPLRSPPDAGAVATPRLSTARSALADAARLAALPGPTPEQVRSRRPSRPLAPSRISGTALAA